MTSRHTKPGRRRLAIAAVATLTGCALPMLGSAADAAPLPAAAVKTDDGGVGFSGFSGLTVATPVKIEMFEPTIPIPASPQLEFDLGYSKVKADSGSSSGRASYFWPGDVVGEGLIPLLQQLGLPQELITALFGSDGYPVQVNSSYPSGESEQSNEQLPGTVMRTKSGQYTTFAKTGFSSDCDVEDPDAPNTGGGIFGNLPIIGGGGLTLPGSSPSPSPSASPSAGEGEDSGEDDTTCPVPSTLSALIDVGGYVASSRVDSSVGVGGEVTVQSRAALGDVSLLSGIITMSGINAKAVASADGPKPKADGVAAYGQMAIAGQKFRFGPDGVEAAGQTSSIPGLSDDPATALKQLGITIEQPGRTTTRDGDSLTTTTEALKVTIDTAVLQPVLQALPLKQLLQTVLDPIPFPDEAGILKSLLLAIPDLAPKIVLHLGYAQSTVETVQGLGGDLPDPSDGGNTGGGTTPAGGSGGTGTSSAPGGSGVPGGTGTTTPGGDTPGSTEALQNVSNLPPLFSISGGLLLGALIGAGVIGAYFRRLGLAALGGGSGCAHGLESGVPDLRKA